jgi:hypothetical protein
LAIRDCQSIKLLFNRAEIERGMIAIPTSLAHNVAQKPFILSLLRVDAASRTRGDADDFNPDHYASLDAKYGGRCFASL